MKYNAYKIGFEKPARLLEIDSINIELDIEGSNKKQRIMIFPRGEFFIKHINDTISFSDAFFDQVEENFNNPKLFKPSIDKNHETKDSYGDIVGNFSRDDKGLYADIKLNGLGERAIKERIYKYISPTFGPQTGNDGQQYENVLISVSLTNTPALQGNLPQLQDQIKLEISKGDTKMNNLVKLTQVLNLQDEASPKAIMEAVNAIKGDLQAALQKIDMLMGEKQESEEKAEAAQKVADEATEELETFKKEAHENEKKEFFDKQVEAGKFLNKMDSLESFQKLYDVNKDVVVIALEAMSGNETMLSTNGVKSTKLSQEDRNIMIGLGDDPNNADDVKNYLDAQMEVK